MTERRLSDATQMDSEADSEAMSTDLSFHSILPSVSTEQMGRPPPPNERFLVTVAVLLSIGLSLVVDQLLLLSSNSLIHYVGIVICTLLTVFTVQWSTMYSSWLTLKRRAFFDEANIFETYTPRDPNWQAAQEPPTPGPTDEDKRPASFACNADSSSFMAVRNSHYKNMYENAQRMAKDLEALERAEGNKAAPDMIEVSDQSEDAADLQNQ